MWKRNGNQAQEGNCHARNSETQLGRSLSGNLSEQDYEQLGPQIEDLIRKHGKLRILCDMHDFHGWTFGGLWEDVKFDVKHFNDVERLAFVGETKWQKGMAAFCKPFTSAKIRYFERFEMDEARKWLTSEAPEPAATS